MRIIREDARRIYIDQDAVMAGRTVLESRKNKIIDADAEQEYKFALAAAEMNAGRRPSPVIIAREVKA